VTAGHLHRIERIAAFDQVPPEILKRIGAVNAGPSRHDVRRAAPAGQSNSVT
jgi:hypothetical protein